MRELFGLCCGVDHDDTRFIGLQLHDGKWIDRIAMQAGGGEEDCSGTHCQGRVQFAGGEFVLPHLKPVRCSISVDQVIGV